jgi:hypothetical protein
VSSSRSRAALLARPRFALPAILLALAALLLLTARPTLADEPLQAPAPDAPPSYRDTVLGDHPTSYWRLGEQPGATIAADELNHHPGYYGGPPTLGFAHSVGDADTAVDLDGLMTQPLGQYIHVSDNGHLAFPGLAPFTLEAWVRPRGYNDVTRRIFSKEGPDGGYLLGIRRDGIVFSRSTFGLQWSTLVTGVDAHRWSHVAATFDGGVMRIYIDGWLAAQGPSRLWLPDARSDLSIGAKQSRWRFYAGGLDELAIYPYALSYGQVLAHSRTGGDIR